MTGRLKSVDEKAYLDRAWGLFRDGKLEEAFFAFGRITDKRESELGLARCLQARSLYDEALKIYCDFPHDKRFQLGAARCWQGKKEYFKALDVFNAVRNDKRFRLGEARCLQEMGWYCIALKMFRAMPNDAEFQLGEAHCLEEMGLYREARDIFRKVPKDKRFKLGEAYCLEGMGQYDGALEIFSAVRNDKRFQLGAARCLEKMGRYHDALDIFDAALEAVPHDKAFLLSKTRCLQKMGRHHDALDIFDAALKAAPHDREFQLGKARCLQKIRRFREALDIFDAFLHDRKFLLGKARCLQKMRSFRKALDIFDAAPDDKEFQLSKARCLGKMNLHHRALLIYKAFPNVIEFQLSKAICLEEQGRYKEAQEIYESNYLQSSKMDFSYCLFLLNRCISGDNKQRSNFLRILRTVKERYPYNTAFLLLEAQYLRKIGNIEQSNGLLLCARNQFPYCRAIYIEQIINCLYERKFNIADIIFSDFKTKFLGDYKAINKVIGLFYRYGICIDIQEKQEEISSVRVIEEVCKTIFTRIKEKDYRVYLTGGGARFLLLSYNKQISGTPHDLDFMTDAPVECVRVLFSCYLDSHIENLCRFSEKGINIDIVCLNRETLTQRISQVQPTICNYDQIYGQDDQHGTKVVIFSPGQNEHVESFLKRKPSCILEVQQSFQEDPVRILKFLKLCAIYFLPVEEKYEEVIIAYKHLLRTLPINIIHSQLNRLFIEGRTDFPSFFNMLMKYMLLDDLFNSNGITQYLKDNTLFADWLIDKIVKIAMVKTIPSTEKLEIVYELFMLTSLLSNLPETQKEFPLELFQQESNKWLSYFSYKIIGKEDNMNISWRAWQIFKSEQLAQFPNAISGKKWSTYEEEKSSSRRAERTVGGQHTPVKQNGGYNERFVATGFFVVSKKPKSRRRERKRQKMWQQLSLPYKDTVRPDELYQAQCVFKQIWRELNLEKLDELKLSEVKAIFTERLELAYYHKITELLSVNSLYAFFKSQLCYYGFRLNAYDGGVSFTTDNLKPIVKQALHDLQLKMS